MTLLEVLEKQFALVVSLPDNIYQMAMSASVGGADGVKVHANVHHRASGRRFDSVSQERERIREVRRAIGSLSLGLMPGTDEAHGSRSEIEEVGLEAGIDFLDMYLDHVPEAYKALGSKMCLMWALGHHWTIEDLARAEQMGATAIEASIVDPEKYHQPLDLQDLEDYSNICKATNLPVIVPTQKAILPEDISQLKEAGVRGLMIGAVVTGDELSTINQATARFRQAIGPRAV